MKRTELVIATRRLGKVYGTHRALEDLVLEVPRGSIFGLLGRNGAGKSTTIRLLTGLLRPSSGEVLLFGRPLARERMHLLGRIGCLVEGPAFYPYLSGARNLKALGDLTGGVSWERVQRCLEQVGLTERGDDAYRGYSTGMRQRLGLAGALVHDPELVILDEPLNGLDPPAVLLVRRLIQRLQEEGKTVLISSHLLHEVELVCGRVAMLERGRLVAQGEVERLIRREGAQVDVTTEQVERALEVARGLEYVVEAHEYAPRPGARGVTVQLADDCPERLNRDLVAAEVSVAGLLTRQRTLEELFHELAGGDGDGGEGAIEAGRAARGGAAAEAGAAIAVGAVDSSAPAAAGALADGAAGALPDGVAEPEPTTTGSGARRRGAPEEGR